MINNLVRYNDFLVTYNCFSLFFIQTILHVYNAHLWTDRILNMIWDVMQYFACEQKKILFTLCIIC